MKSNNKNKLAKILNQNGYSIIELMLAVAIFSITISGIVFFMIDILKSSDRAVVLNQATSLASEGLEAVKSVAIENYETNILPLDGFSGSLVFNNDSELWSLVPGPAENINSVLVQSESRNFERIIYIDELTTDETATSSLKYVRSIVSWNENQSTTTLEMVISNWSR